MTVTFEELLRFGAIILGLATFGERLLEHWLQRNGGPELRLLEKTVDSFDGRLDKLVDEISEWRKSLVDVLRSKL